MLTSTRDKAKALVAGAMLATLLAICSGLALAHSGGLNNQGCHNNRKTGDYHCHRAPAATQKADREGKIKKSKSGICHAPGTTYYGRTRNFTTYDTLDACLKSGGRLPKR